MKRFVEKGMVKELPSFLEAVKADVANAVDEGRINDPEGYKQFLAAMAVHNN